VDGFQAIEAQKKIRGAGECRESFLRSSSTITSLSGVWQRELEELMTKAGSMQVGNLSSNTAYHRNTFISWGACRHKVDS
jgi:hypothetical protein